MMAGHRMARWGGWLGIASVGLSLASFLVASGQPDNSKDNAAQLFRNYYAKSSNQGQDSITWILMIFGVAAFVWFLAAFLARLRAAEGEGRTLSLAALLGGGGYALLLFIAVSLFTVIGITLDYADAYKLDTGDAILFQSLGYAFLVAAMLGAGALTAATFFIARITRVVPMWVAWIGLVVAVASLGIFFTAFLNILLFWLWILLVSITWLVAERGKASATVPAA